MFNIRGLFTNPSPPQLNWRIAREILSDHPGAESAAAIHIVRAWHELVRLLPPEKQSPPECVQQLAHQLKLQFSERLPEEAWLADLDAFSALAASPESRMNERLSRAHLRLHCKLLENAIFEGASAFRNVEPRTRRLSWQGGLVAAVLFAAVWGFCLWAGSLRVWRRELFSNLELSGAPASISSTARPVVPFEGEYNYSERWETCLKVDISRTILFEVGSDDGSRLFVDGNLLIDSWQDQPFSRKQGSTTLEPGWHHLRLDYYQKAGTALVSFSAWKVSHDTGLVTPRFFRHPGMSLDELDPCEKFNANRD